MAFAAPKPEDRLAFADELAQVRTALAAAKKQVEKNVYREYKKELNEIEVEYQFTLLRSLDLFHKEMLRAKLPDRLYEIKENLTDTAGTFTYQINLPDTNWNWNNIICKQCHKNALRSLCQLQMSFAVKYAELWKHWMVPTLTMKNFINAAISRSLNNDSTRRKYSLQVLHGKTQKNHHNKRAYTIR